MEAEMSARTMIPVGRAHADARLGDRVDTTVGGTGLGWIAGADVSAGQRLAVWAEDGRAYPIRDGSVCLPGRIESIATTEVVK